MKKIVLLSFLTLLTVTGCSSREEADRKLAKGCEAGARSLMEGERYDRQIAKVKKTTFGGDAQGRSVRLEVTTKTKADGRESDDVVFCVFQEEYNAGFIGWSAMLDRLTIGEDVYGRENGAIKGDLQDFLKLNDTVSDGMR